MYPDYETAAVRSPYEEWQAREVRILKELKRRAELRRKIYEMAGPDALMRAAIKKLATTNISTMQIAIDRVLNPIEERIWPDRYLKNI